MPPRSTNSGVEIARCFMDFSRQAFIDLHTLRNGEAEAVERLRISEELQSLVVDFSRHNKWKHFC